MKLSRELIRLILLAILVAATVWVTNMGRVGIYKTFSYGSIVFYGLAHLKMVVVAVGIATLIGVPLGVLVTMPIIEKVAVAVIGLVSVGQTVPSLAVIAIMAPVLGFTFKSAIVALVIYGLLPIIRNAYVSINSIDPAIIEAARGMGMSRWGIIRKIQLPLARGVIIAGIRVSTVITVGTAELAVLVGGQSLGKITLTGVYTREALLIIQGAAPTAILAVVLGFLLERVEHWLTPRGLELGEP